jgi:uncharacterized protein with FMN-binding domain
MKKFILAAVLIIAIISFVVYERFARPTDMQTVAVAPPTPTAQKPLEREDDDGFSLRNLPNLGPTTPPPVAPQGGYKDGTYTGTLADALYGNLQVVAVIKGGKIVDVQWPIYPDHKGNTSEVSARSLPKLKQEAIVAQSTNVDIITGATQTSQAFQVSLTDALSGATK